MAYQGAEDDLVLPPGAVRLDVPEPLSGKTYVMYHGTTRKAARAIQASGFLRSADGMLGPGVYLSRDLQKASRYPINHPEQDRVVIRVKVNVGKVIAINRQRHPRQKTWHDPKYGEVFDTAWVPPGCGMVPSGLEEDCVWDPSRIQVIDVIEPRPSQTARSIQALQVARLLLEAQSPLPVQSDPVIQALQGIQSLRSIQSRLVQSASVQNPLLIPSLPGILPLRSIQSSPVRSASAQIPLLMQALQQTQSRISGQPFSRYSSRRFK